MPVNNQKRFLTYFLIVLGILGIGILFALPQSVKAACGSYYNHSSCYPSYCGATDGCDQGMGWCCYNSGGQKCDCTEECPPDYWSSSYRCSGNIRQQAYIDMYCSGGLMCSTAAAYCYYSTTWYTNTDCGSGYYTGAYQCSGSMIQAQYRYRGCSGSTCYDYYGWVNYGDCGSDYWSGTYSCSGTMRIGWYISRGCSAGSCYSYGSWQNYQECGGDYWGSSYTCSGTMLQRLYYSRGCSGTTCYGPTSSWQNYQECGSDYWGSSYTCSGTMLQRLYVSRGCSGTTCYSNSYWSNYTECGSGYYENSYQCSGNTVQRLYRYKGCSSSACYDYTGWVNQTTCSGDYTCSSGSCVDTTPPSFSSFYVSPSGWTNANPVWYWSAYDNGSGMRSTNPYYIFLNGVGQGYTASTSYQPSLSSGTHRVSINAYDNVGNARGSGDVYAYIDKTTPSSSFSVNKTSFAPGETITLTITASDSHSGINVVQAYYQGAWHNQSCAGASSCTKSWSFTESSLGSYTYTGNTYDQAGNAAYTSPSTITVNVVDNVPPSFSSFYVSPTGWTNGNPIWSWSATDAGSGIRSTNPYYIFLNGVGQGYTASTSYQPSLSSGSHYVSINAYDNAGNVIGSVNVYAYVDKTNPSGTFTVNKTSVVLGETITLTLTASDSLSGINVVQANYQGSWHNQSCGGASPCTKTWSFSESSLGTYTYTGNIYDVVGNGSYSSPSTVTVNVVDTTPPSFSYFNVSPTGWTNGNPIWSWSATDMGGSGMRTTNRYAIFLNDNFQYYTNDTSYQPNLSSGSYSVYINAYDNADNIIGSGYVRGYVDKINPSGSLSVNKTSFEPDETIILTLTASDSLSGVNTVQANYQGSWHSLSCSGASPCTKTWSFSESSVGSYTYTGNVYDIAGNGALSSPSTVTVNVINVVDTTPPTFTSFLVSPITWTNGNPTWSWLAMDSGSGMRDTNRYYIFLDGVGQNYTMSTSYQPNLGSGTHWVSINAYDNADNIRGSGNVYAYVDKTVPNTPTINSPASGSVQTGNFSVSVSGDADFGGSDINKCYYHIYDSGVGWTKSGAERPCNSSFTVTGGSDMDCRTNNGTCTVYVFSRDNANNDSLTVSRSFNYQGDTSPPTVSELYFQLPQDYPIQVVQGVNFTYKADVSDNNQVTDCDLYINNINQGSMSISSGVATKTLILTSLGPFSNNYVKCSDPSNNWGSGPVVDLKVGVTYIISLIADPTTGTTTTKFDLITDVYCSLKGNLFFKVDCTNDGPPEHEIEEPYILGVGSYNFTFVDVCQYSQPGTYTIRLDFQQATGQDSETVQVTVIEAVVNVALTAIPASGNTETKFSLKADVTGDMTGNVNYKFDCTNNGTWEKEVYNISSDTYTAADLCQYPVGTHTAKVYIEKGSGTATATVSIPVAVVPANEPPVANFSCDASLCGPGSSSSNCIGYQGCIISADNLSSDLDGLEDIESVGWVVKDPATGQIKDQLDCSPTNILCDYALPGFLAPKVYGVTITVSDLAGETRSYSRNVQLRKDISADFVCSSDNLNWKACNDPSFRPVTGSTVYFHDNLSDSLLNTLGLSGKKSILSEGATKFTKKIWKKDGVVFSTCQSSSGCTNSNPSTIIQGTEITLEIEDDSGRTGEADSQITTQASLPEWEEIAPF